MTTTVVYPDADPESTTVDGYVQNQPAGQQLWATIRGAASGTAASSVGTFGPALYIMCGSTSGYYGVIARGFFLFSTSAVGAGDTVSSATLSLYKYSSYQTFSGTPPALDVVSSNPASNTDIATGDFDQVGTTAYGSVAYASIKTSAYTDISLDTSCITKAGVTKLGTRASWDTADSPTWQISALAYVYVYYADNAGTTSDPKLTVVHEAATGAMLTQSRLLQTALTGGRLVR